MRARTSLVCLGLIALFAHAGNAAAQTGSLRGTVRDVETMAPISGARVEALSGASVAGRVLTDQQGRFNFPALAPGSYTVTAVSLGYAEERSALIQVQAGAGAEVNLDLAPGAVSLNPVVVTASRREERALEAPARVEVVTEVEIESRPTISPVDHLRSVPSVDIAKTGLQSANIVVRGFNNVFSGALHTLTDHRIAGVPSLRVNLMHFVPTTDSDIQRMEVVLGPGAALYGPNTANGVLQSSRRARSRSRARS
jgi:iron complex outermembrane receptor protein